MLLAHSLRTFSVQSTRVFIHLRSSKKPVLSLALSTAAEEMDSPSPCVLVLSGKSSPEMEIAKTLKSNNTLKLPDNSEVRIFMHSEIQRPPSEESFQIDLFLKSLLTNQFGRFFIWSPRLPSTHDIVSHNFCALPIGAVCTADIQSKGRGRSKNVWESPIGCLLFSFTIQMDDGKIVPLLQYVISLAITEGIKEICDNNGLPYLDVRIKWPNDLYLNGLKVGGILCTSTYKSKKFNVSAGKQAHLLDKVYDPICFLLRAAKLHTSSKSIGLNVDNDKPTVCLNSVLRELSIASYKFTREDILAAFFNKFEKLYDLFIHQGFQALEELYYKTWLHSGQRVIVQEKIEEQVVENVVSIQGLTPSGYLLAVGEDNRMCELHPDGNSLDFFKGLVRRKL